MRTLILTMILAFGLSTANAQTECTHSKGDWYVGTGDIADVAWTEWAVSPMLGYGINDNLMVGFSVSQADSSEDLSMDLKLVQNLYHQRNIEK